MANIGGQEMVWNTAGEGSWEPYAPNPDLQGMSPDQIRSNFEQQQAFYRAFGNPEIDTLDPEGGRTFQPRGTRASKDNFLDKYSLALVAGLVTGGLGVGVGADPSAASAGAAGADTAAYAGGGSSSMASGGSSLGTEGLVAAGSSPEAVGLTNSGFAEGGSALSSLGSTASGVNTSGFGSDFDATSFGQTALSPFQQQFANFFNGASFAPTGGWGSPGGVSTGLSLFSGLYGMNEARRLKKLSQMAMDRSDPFGPERAGYADKLRALYANPSNVENLPGFKAGLTAVERKMASQGYLGSGNMMVALKDYGERAFDSEATRLASLAGAGMRPDTDALLRGRAAAGDLASRSLASLGYAARGF